MNQERTSGQYKLESVKLYSSIRDDFIEISDFVGELNIYEDMFNNTISGNIIIEDMWNMIAVNVLLRAYLSDNSRSIPDVGLVISLFFSESIEYTLSLRLYDVFDCS